MCISGVLITLEINMARVKCDTLHVQLHSRWWKLILPILIVSRALRRRASQVKENVVLENNAAVRTFGKVHKTLPKCAHLFII